MLAAKIRRRSSDQDRWLVTGGGGGFGQYFSFPRTTSPKTKNEYR